nr:glycosyltransferase [Ornithinimicrobium cryptoxanthini]
MLLTNIYPTRATPTGATFIRSRLRALADLETEIVPMAVWPTWTTAATVVRAPFRRAEEGPPVEPFLPVTAPLGPGQALRRRLESRAGRRWLDDITAQVLAHRAGPVDVVHAHGMYDLPAGLVAMRVADRLDVPYVVSMHGTDVNEVMPRRRQFYSQVLMGASATIYVSAALRDRSHSLTVTHPQAHVIPNGVDPATFTPGARATVPTVLYVGNLEPVKGVDRLPTVWTHVRAEIPSARLVVVGTGSLLARIRRGLDDQSVSFLGRLDPACVAREMARAHVLVLPSRGEGWPTVIMEAYATGTPVVATAVGGVAEAIVEPDHLVPDGPGLEERLAQAVVRVLRAAEGSRPELIEAARPHTWPQVAARELEVYRSC